MRTTWLKDVTDGAGWLRRLAVVAVLACLPLQSAVARMLETPRSFSLQDKSLAAVQRKTLAAVDSRTLRDQDSARAKTAKGPLPVRFAVQAAVGFDLDNSGTWQKLADGQLWRLRIQSPGAMSHNLGITRFDMPEGAKLWLYDPAGKRVEGPYVWHNRSSHGRLWTPIIEGDEVVVEVFVPNGVARPAITIGQVNQGYRDLSETSMDKSGSCNNDVICPVGDPWRPQIRSVARYTISGSFLCSGQLVNNTAFDLTPYFLSAAHCNVTAANDDTLVFYWKFESPNCGDLGGGSTSMNQTGAIFRASYAPSDFLLVELEEEPDPLFDVYYSGWDATGVAPAATVGIHHPSGDEKAISFNNNAVTSTAYGSNTVNAAANHWRVDMWEDGTTEGGSSGSCLWDASSKRCVGQLHGGAASCSATTSPDWYGKFSASWTGGGTAATRLKDWLDPGNTGIIAIDGDPHVTTLDGTRYDFQGAGEYTILRDPSGVEIQARQTPIATSFTPGADPYSGLATCVSLNSAVATRVGKYRVTYQPNLNGVPDPKGLELRIDGRLTTLGAGGINLGNGGSINPTGAPGGIKITYPDKYNLQVTPGWWSTESKWYLNIGVSRKVADGANGAEPGSNLVGGIGAPLASKSWLPPLPDGTGLGPRPAALHDRYVHLYKKFGDAWRVSHASTLFDYAPGTSTETFTNKSWPMESPPCNLPGAEPVKPLPLEVAVQECRIVKDERTRQNCVFDVMITGERGFAQTYARTQEVNAKEAAKAAQGGATK
ncbi:MAG: hypothetical protein JF591_10495 [Lysobacter sp.]|nr:hypothetical protein [Lysobacter sp.]